MNYDLNYFQILDTAVKDITKRVAKLDFKNSNPSYIDINHSSCLITTTNGDYKLTIIMHAENRLLKAITENMKRRTVEGNDDIVICTTEYFNILCGHVVSAMNRQAHAAARFAIPRLVEGNYIDTNAKETCAFYYDSDYGPICVETHYQYPDCKAS